MKTKLVLTIKVDELDEDTTPLYLALAKGKALKISDIFDPNQEVIPTAVGDMYAVRNGDARPTEIKCIMYTRGIKVPYGECEGYKEPDGGSWYCSECGTKLK